MAARLLQKPDQLERYAMQTVEECTSFRLSHQKLFRKTISLRYLEMNGDLFWYIIHINRHKHTHNLETNMRTNIVLDDKLVKRAQKLTGIKTKREVVHEALRTLVLLREQGEIRSLRGKLKWEGDLDQQRQSRFPAK
jgi:Arc/MetJ family transcription regulator